MLGAKLPDRRAFPRSQHPERASTTEMTSIARYAPSRVCLIALDNSIGRLRTHRQRERFAVTPPQVAFAPHLDGAGVRAACEPLNRFAGPFVHSARRRGTW